MFTYLHGFAFLGFMVVLAQGFNLDTRTVRVYSQPNRTGNDFFGFSVALHSYGSTRWLLVGAPLSNVTAPDGRLLSKYGAIFQCQTAGSKDCVLVNVDNTPEKTDYFPPGSSTRVAMETKSGQMLGATLRSRNGTVLVCAPRYIHKIDAISSRDPYPGPKLRPWLSGGCYLLQGDLSRVESVLQPYRWKGNAFKVNCQLGFSADISQDQGVVMGKVGWSWHRTNLQQKSLYWSGGLESYSLINKQYHISDRTQLGKFDYMGYDVASGHFSEADKEGFAGGAPRGNNMLGKVLVYDVNKLDGIVFKSQLELPKENQTGSYFGSTLCSVDLNNDGLSDLLVGAPLYTDINWDEGRVYVYLNIKGALTLMKNTVLIGDRIEGARFGSAIANVGDLNRDGYQDVVIGAPYEGPNSGGAVYVYYGTRNGIEAKYRQKISSESIDSHLKGFGYSIVGAVDVDNNGYPDIAVGSYLSDHAVLFRTRRIVEIQATIKPDRTKIDVEKKRAFICVEKDGSVHKCLNVTVCFLFKDREPSNRQDLKISYSMEADADIITLELRRMYFHDAKHKNVTTAGHFTIPKQNREYCLAPFTVHISDKYQFIDLLNPLTFDLSFSLDDKACLSVPDVPCPVLDAYRPTTIRNNEVTFQKQCKANVCKPDLSVTGRIRLPGNHQVLSVGSNGVLTVDLDIENKAKDAAYRSTVTLYFPTELSYIGPTSTKNVLCYSVLESNNTKAVCHIGNPFKAKAKKLLSIEFSAQEIASDFVINVVAESASKDTDLKNNKLSLPVTTKYLTDMEITGISQPEEVIYNGKVVKRKNVKRETDIGPLIVQSVTIKNHGPSFVEGAVVTIQVPRLQNKDDPDSMLLQLKEVELSGGPGKCNAVIHAFPIPGQNLTRPVKETREAKPRDNGSKDVKMECSSAVCYVFDCRLGVMPSGGSVKIKMTSRLWKSTLTRIKQAGQTYLITAARLTVPSAVMQSDTSNDDVKILLTTRPSHFEDRKEEISWWIILVSILGGLLLLALVIFIMYKFGFFSRDRPEKDDALGPEETKPMNV